LETDIGGATPNKINLGDNPADNFNTTSQTIMGAVNELESTKVTKTGAETIAGDKTFTGNIYGQQTVGAETLNAGGTGLIGKLTIRDAAGVPLFAFDINTSTYLINPNFKFAQELTCGDDFFSGGSEFGNNGRIFVRNSSNATRVLLYSNGSKSLFDDGITNLPTPTADADAVNKLYVDTGVQESHIYYIRTGGSDSKSGKLIANAFLTATQAFNAVQSQTPSSTNQFTIMRFDAGIHDGVFDMTNVPWTTYFAPGQTLRTFDAIIQDNCVIHAKIIEKSSGTGEVFTKIGTESSYINAEIIRNTVTSGAGIRLNGSGGTPILHINAKEFTVKTRTDTLSTNAGVAGIRYIRADYIRGKMFTTQVGDKLYVQGQYIDGDFDLNANSELHLSGEWNGSITNSSTLTKIYLNGGAANNNLSGSTINANALVYKNGETFRRKTTAVNYNPSALTDHRIIAFTDVSVARTCIISTEDIQSASPLSPRYFTIKDESGQVTPTNTITVSGETGNIDGSSNIVLSAPYSSLELYSDGTNLWIK
jgi:hypothetical protein